MPLLVSLGFAVGFVALRLAYRVMFGGWPATPDAWATAALGVLRSSTPFVVVIVVFGVLNTVIDVRSALARGVGRGPLRNVRTALVIALSAYPSLLESVRLVSQSRRMRHDRSLRSLVVPVLERSLERGVTLGAAMEQRGFGAREPLYGMCDAPVVARDLRVGFGAFRGAGIDPSWELVVGNLMVAHGSCVLVTGPTGSGKSALLRAVTGRLQHSGGGWQTGVLEVGGLDRRAAQPHETAGFVSLVEQNVRDGFVTSTVFDEVAFGLRLFGMRGDEVDARVSETLERLEIAHLARRAISALSAGEATLVALAAAIVTRPSLLLLDEPIADLDEHATERLVHVLTELRDTTGITMLIAEHRVGAVEHLADVRLELGEEQAAEVAKRTEFVADEMGGRGASITPLFAPNGAGKTTWLTAFAENHANDVRLVPEDPALLFCRETVEAECVHNDRLARREPGSTRDLALELVPNMPMDAHPRDLSTGQRLALACALQIAVRPRLLLLDEPTRGLDTLARTHLATLLTAVAATGTSVIFATHDREFAGRFAQREVVAS